MRPVSTLLVLLFAAAPFALAGDPPPIPGPLKAEPKRYTIARRTAPIALDGRLNDPAWEKAAWTDDFVDIEGPAKPLPRYRTRAKMLWDDRYLYIAAELEEPDVWATYKDRDQIVFHENDFEVFIDPNGDGGSYYELEVNCLGTIFDLYLHRKYRDGGPAVHGWNAAELVTAIDIQGTANDPRDEDRGWTLEWAIPWAALRPPTAAAELKELEPDAKETERGGAAPKPGDAWRINFSRVQWKHNHEELDAQGKRVPTNRPRVPVPNSNSIRQEPPKPYEKRTGEREDNWVWSPQEVIDMHLPDRWGRVTFGN